MYNGTEHNGLNIDHRMQSQMLQAVHGRNLGRFVAIDEMGVVGGSTQIMLIMIELVPKTIGTKRMRAETRQQKECHQQGKVFSLCRMHDFVNHF